jgi:hypothetical protein
VLIFLVVSAGYAVKQKWLYEIIFLSCWKNLLNCGEHHSPRIAVEKVLSNRNKRVFGSRVLDPTMGCA